MNGINLLGNKKTLEVQTSPKVRFLRRLAIFLLFGIAGASIILFLLISFSPLPSLQKEEQQALSTLSASHPDIAKLFLVKDRLQGVSSIIKNRLPYDQKLLQIMEEMPKEIAITEMEMERNIVSLSLSSGSLTQLDTFLNNLVARASEKKEFASVTMIELITDEQRRTYLMTVRVSFL